MKSIQKRYIVSGVSSDEIQSFTSEKEATDFILSQDDGKEYFIMPAYKTVNADDAKFRVSVIMPIWENPSRTIRAIMSIVNQTTNGWQLICLGDGCPNFKNTMESGWFKDLQSKAYLNGNEIFADNTLHFGGYGFYQRQLGKTIARGKYVVYLDNDDVVKPIHLATRLAAAENADQEYDLLYFNTYVEPIRGIRDAQLEHGRIGHSEIMYRTEFLRTLPPLTDQYGHDWTQIKQALDKGARTLKVVGEDTYIVKSLPDNKEQGIN